MSAKSEIELLANYIMAEVPGEPSQSEGAGATAVRIIKKLRAGVAQDHVRNDAPPFTDVQPERKI